VVAGREGHYSALPFVIGKLEQPVGRPPQLERVPRLQALALEPRPNAANFALDERRPLDKAPDTLGGRDDVFTRNQLCFS
jgi:hypothetical protein